MNIFFLVVIFAVCVYFLVKSSDKFVDAATIIADKLGVSHFIIGLTVVSIGTSLPELGASIAASLAGDSEIVIGNIVGSNIANIAFVLGIGVLLASIKIKKSHFKIDAPLLILITAIFAIMGFDGVYNWIDGLVLLLLFLFYISFLIQREDIVTEAASEIEFDHKTHRYHSNILRMLLSIVVLYVSAKYLVFSGEGIAEFLGISNAVIGLVGIAIGTSLPELAVTISSAKKGNPQLLLGNVIGSNISNILLIGGVASLITPLTVATSLLYFIYPIFIFLTILMLIFMRLRAEFRNMEGISFLFIYMFFLVLSVYIGFI
ncbi:calcium/sodium antiporter [Candidatus Woesearchaeota archaeon]|nr:MAG: calcium/sodium antiporter [Candidatus Woesearchaeota archaeon]